MRGSLCCLPSQGLGFRHEAKQAVDSYAAFTKYSCQSSSWEDVTQRPQARKAACQQLQIHQPEGKGDKTQWLLPSPSEVYAGRLPIRTRRFSSPSRGPKSHGSTTGPRIRPKARRFSSSPCNGTMSRSIPSANGPRGCPRYWPSTSLSSRTNPTCRSSSRRQSGSVASNPSAAGASGAGVRGYPLLRRA